MPVIVMNQNNYGVWIWQPLLAEKFNGLNISHGIMGLDYIVKGRILRWHFSHYCQLDIMATVIAVHDEPDTKPSTEANTVPHPKFEPHPNTKVVDFDFQKEVECLPFKLNSGRSSFG